ncbi:hypothetical protein F5Y12DRAFT_225273 [Xylaria sp. FL1777]|nr:hypothetical protein F5Y12DRAFT_225273 [Xylaria sp. FL1777]
MAPPFERENTTPEPCTSTETVTLRSPSGTEFVVPARPLAHLSKYFRTALNSDFNEAKTREFDLFEYCDDKVLQAFTNWVCLRSSGVPYGTLQVPFLERLDQKTMIKGWLFGDYIFAPSFQNDMMHLMVNVENQDFEKHTFKTFGQCVPRDSPLEKYLVDRFCSLMFHYDKSRIDATMEWSTADLRDKVCRRLSEAIWDKKTCIEKPLNDFSACKAKKYEVNEEEEA